MANVLEFTDPAALLAKFEEVKGGDDMLICYFTGGVNADTGKSWCPDCDVARPAIAEHVLGQTELTVLKGVVEERNSWVGVADHPFKAHNELKAGGVPCLLLWGNG